MRRLDTILADNRRMNMLSMNRINQMFFLLFGLSICIFKGGMYLFPSLLIVIFLLCNSGRIFQNQYMKDIFILSLMTFVVGLLSQLVNMKYTSDVGFFAKKSIFLLLIPILLFYLQNRTSRIFLFVGFISGLVVANLYCYYLFYLSDFTMKESLVDSFWDILRWREIISFSICLAIPFLFHSNHTPRMVAVFLIALCLPSIIFSGGRVIYFSVFTTLLVYILLVERRKIKYFLIFLISFSGIIYMTPVSAIKAMDYRIESIFNTESDYSNIGRLHMYKEGASFIYDEFVNNPGLIIFGMGEKGFHEEFVDYLQRKNKLKPILEITNNQFSLTDQHNAFLNTLSKRGILYFILYYMLVFLLLKKTYHRAKTGDVYSQAAFLLLICYLAIGLLYGNAFSFETIILFTLWCLFYSLGDADMNIRNDVYLADKDTL